jgi:hypothetical protein
MLGTISQRLIVYQLRRRRHAARSPPPHGSWARRTVLAGGITVAIASRMRHYIDSLSSESVTVVPLVRWIFERRGSAITCEVDLNAAHTCDVAVIPHWNAASAVVEHFDGPIQAMERHAELAQELRNAGWVVTRHSARRRRESA